MKGIVMERSQREFSRRRKAVENVMGHSKDIAAPKTALKRKTVSIFSIERRLTPAPVRLPRLERSTVIRGRAALREDAAREA